MVGKRRTMVPVGLENPVLPSGVAMQAFAPTAFYDSYMDCIRVFTHDRSVTEDRYGDEFTLYRTNHRGPFDPVHVGFCLKGVRHMFAELGLPQDGVQKLTVIIEALVKSKPQSTVAKFLGEFSTAFQNADALEVNLDEQAMAA